jgi:CheY-like chemotaxis protein
MKRILVVDDEQMIRDVVAEILRDEGYLVDLAPDGRSALEQIGEQQPDLVLMDVMMPGMDGREAYAAMRARRDLTEVPVILMSAAVPRRRLDPDIDAYLPKPFGIEALLELVERLIGPPD